MKYERTIYFDIGLEKWVSFYENKTGEIKITKKKDKLNELINFTKDKNLDYSKISKENSENYVLKRLVSKEQQQIKKALKAENWKALSLRDKTLIAQKSKNLNFKTDEINKKLSRSKKLAGSVSSISRKLGQSVSLDSAVFCYKPESKYLGFFYVSKADFGGLRDLYNNIGQPDRLSVSLNISVVQFSG